MNIAERTPSDAEKTFDYCRAEILSVLEGELQSREDGFLLTLRDELNGLKAYSAHELASAMRPRGPIMTGDTVILSEGMKVPAHIAALTEVRAIEHVFAICASGENIARKAASHLERQARRMGAFTRVGTHVFIGHGRSPLWRELKDFLESRLKLPTDEFNRVPVAGISNSARLGEMLEASVFAFLVMTAEDEQASGDVHARLNVVHEAALFQGRLGFSRAIVMLEEGCAEFTNISGLGQLRFPRGNISAKFEDVRAVLEREGLVKPTN